MEVTFAGSQHRARPWPPMGSQMTHPTEDGSCGEQGDMATEWPVVSGTVQSGRGCWWLEMLWQRVQQPSGNLKSCRGCTKPFCHFEENSLGIKMLITIQKYCKLSSYFSHLCYLLVYNFPVCAVNTDYSFSLKLFSG